MKTSRFAAAAVAGLLALTLAACGDSTDDNATSPGVTAEAAPTDESTSETTDEAATSSDAADDEATTDESGTGDDSAATTEAGAAGDDASSSTDASGGSVTVEDQLAELEAVVAVAEGEAGGTAYEIDDQDDDGSWEVDVAVDDRSVEVTVSADGQVVGTEDDDLDEDDRDALAAATITIVDAATTGLGEVEGTLDDIELDEEDGTFAWEVTIDTGEDDDVEVYVDVTTGEVLRVDRD